MYARNIGQGNSCPVECVYTDIACGAGGDKSKLLCQNHRVERKQKEKSNK